MEHITVSAHLAVSGEVLGSVDIAPTDTIRSLRSALAEQLREPAEQSLRLLSASGTLLPELSTISEAGILGNPCSVAVVRVCSVVATASNDCTARIFLPDTGECQATLTGHFGNVYSAVFAANWRRVVTASEDRTARMWDAESAECLQILAGHRGEVYSAVFSPCGRVIVTASEDSTVRLWEAASGACSWCFTEHEGEVYLALFQWAPHCHRLTRQHCKAALSRIRELQIHLARAQHGSVPC